MSGAVDPDRQTRHGGRLDPGQGVGDPGGDPPTRLGRTPGPDHRDRPLRIEGRDAAPHEEHGRRLLDPPQPSGVRRIVQGHDLDPG